MDFEISAPRLRALIMMQPNGSNTSLASAAVVDGAAAATDATVASIQTGLSHQSTSAKPSKRNVWSTKEIKGLYDGVFVLPDPAKEDEVYESIAGLPGSNPKLAEEVAWTELPYDFLLDKSEYNNNELVVRFSYGGLEVFMKKIPKETIDDRGKTTHVLDFFPIDPGKELLKEFETRMRRLRRDMINVLHVETSRMWKSLMDQCLPELKCKSFDHFLVLLRTKPHDNEMRRIVHIVTHTMWSRESMIRIERALMEKLKIRHLQKNSNGADLKSARRAGFIAKIATRVKQTAFIDKVRDVGRKEKKEILYVRSFKDKKPQEGVVSVVEATTKTHGFNGCIGLFSGHPDLPSCGSKEAAKSTALDLKRLDLEDFIRSRLSSIDNKPTSVEAVMEEWSAIKDNGVVVTLESTGSETSPLSEVRSSRALLRELSSSLIVVCLLFCFRHSTAVNRRHRFQHCRCCFQCHHRFQHHRCCFRFNRCQ